MIHRNLFAELPPKRTYWVLAIVRCICDEGRQEHPRGDSFLCRRLALIHFGVLHSLPRILPEDSMAIILARQGRPVMKLERMIIQEENYLQRYLDEHPDMLPLDQLELISGR